MELFSQLERIHPVVVATSLSLICSRADEGSALCSSARSQCFRGRRISLHCKVSFPRKEPKCSFQSTQLFVKDFFVIMGALCQQINSSGLGSSNKTTHQFHQWKPRNGHLREVMIKATASFLFLFRLIFYFHSFLFIHVFCFLMENITKDFYLDIYW